MYVEENRFTVFEKTSEGKEVSAELQDRYAQVQMMDLVMRIDWNSHKTNFYEFLIEKIPVVLNMSTKISFVQKFFPEVLMNNGCKVNEETLKYLKSLYLNFVQWRAEYQDTIMSESTTLKSFFDEYHKYLNESSFEDKLIIQLFSLYSADDDGDLEFTNEKGDRDSQFFLDLLMKPSWNFFRQYLVNLTSELGLRQTSKPLSIDNFLGQTKPRKDIAAVYAKLTTMKL